MLLRTNATPLLVMHSREALHMSLTNTSQPTGFRCALRILTPNINTGLKRLSPSTLSVNRINTKRNDLEPRFPLLISGSLGSLFVTVLRIMNYELFL
ncbi:hypothetical protein BDV38DRAFT_235741 [Aspergillus pseudotamarii]|uniref:Uncharacterized protein n=1 Tax=Aspergillus pseudotamarii TaxID=132259 RepID=A0A5N6T6V2_ASPPS|nr:uncharacterized protein BDV38DRAFT_235741 [Aspergillus pseudotamarii]KAE8142084.1 hypothetical protein BDV38DRAFT_235741 [Aspergillus pseudotamarii]